MNENTEEDLKMEEMIQATSPRNKEIKELDMDKYIVIKKDDLRYLSLDLKAAIAQIVANINYSRMLIDKKSQNQYLVLNLDDEIDLHSFFRETEKRLNKTIYWWPQQKVKDIAIDLVNAILKTK